jgi:hypothetical protein
MPAHSKPQNREILRLFIHKQTSGCGRFGTANPSPQAAHIQKVIGATFWKDDGATFKFEFHRGKSGRSRNLIPRTSWNLLGKHHIIFEDIFGDEVSVATLEKIDCVIGDLVTRSQFAQSLSRFRKTEPYDENSAHRWACIDLIREWMHRMLSADDAPASELKFLQIIKNLQDEMRSLFAHVLVYFPAYQADIFTVLATLINEKIYGHRGTYQDRGEQRKRRTPVCMKMLRS